MMIVSISTIFLYLIITLFSSQVAEVRFAIGQATFSEGGGNQTITVILQNGQLASNQNVEVYIDDGTDSMSSALYIIDY